MRCRNCKDLFEPKYFMRKFCTKDECNNLYFEELKTKAIKKAEKQKREYNKANTKNSNNSLQVEINKLSKMIDMRLGFRTCIDCNKTMDLIHAAHLHNVSGNENLRYNLHNLHSARAHCNMYSSEHKVGYRSGLIERYGLDYRNFVVDELPIKYSYLGLNKKEIAQALKNTREIIRNFESYKFIDGIQGRDFLNNLIGIYKQTE